MNAWKKHLRASTARSRSADHRRRWVIEFEDDSSMDGLLLVEALRSARHEIRAGRKVTVSRAPVPQRLPGHDFWCPKFNGWCTPDCRDKFCKGQFPEAYR